MLSGELEVDLIKSSNKNKNKPLFSNVDGIYFLTHEGGCGGSLQTDSVTLCNLLAGYINNPNIAGATVLSLGCQHAQIDAFKSIAKFLVEFKKTSLFFRTTTKQI